MITSVELNPQIFLVIKNDEQGLIDLLQSSLLNKKLLCPFINQRKFLPYKHKPYMYTHQSIPSIFLETAQACVILSESPLFIVARQLELVAWPSMEG
ncbi:hypothetical protein [Kaarinaea lacus]